MNPEGSGGPGTVELDTTSPRKISCDRAVPLRFLPHHRRVRRGFCQKPSKKGCLLATRHLGCWGSPGGRGEFASSIRNELGISRWTWPIQRKNGLLPQLLVAGWTPVYSWLQGKFSMRAKKIVNGPLLCVYIWHHMYQICIAYGREKATSDDVPKVFSQGLCIYHQLAVACEYFWPAGSHIDVHENLLWLHS